MALEGEPSWLECCYACFFCVWCGGGGRQDGTLSLKSSAFFPALGNGEEVVYVTSSPPCWLLTFSWHRHMRRWLGKERKQRARIKALPCRSMHFPQPLAGIHLPAGALRLREWKGQAKKIIIVIITQAGAEISNSKLLTLQICPLHTS